MQLSHNTEPTSGATLLPGIQWLLQAIGVAAALLVITQNIDVDFSAKEVHTKLQYRGNVLLDLKKQQAK